jgi:hypothetical protein
MPGRVGWTASRVLRWATIVLALVVATVPIPAAAVEHWYSQRAYLAWQRHLTSLSNVVPFGVTDVLAASALVAGAAAVRFAWRSRRTTSRWRAAARVLEYGTFGAAAVYLLFLASWGLNYRREPLSARLDFDRGRVTSASVLQLARDVVAGANRLYVPAHADGSFQWEALPATLGPAFAQVQRGLAHVTPAVAGVPKWSMLTYYFERAGVSGMTNPFALEVLVDRGQVPAERPFVAAHEWAHLAGYATEAEANFVGWLVCLQGPPPAAYSGQLALLLYLLPALERDERAMVVREIAPGPRRDLAEIRRHAALGWPWLQRPAWWVYDRYLRANRVEEGVRSYGAALELMVGTRFVREGVPKMKPILSESGQPHE